MAKKSNMSDKQRRAMFWKLHQNRSKRSKNIRSRGNITKVELKNQRYIGTDGKLTKHAPIEAGAGIGPQRAKKLRAMGINTIDDYEAGVRKIEQEREREREQKMDQKGGSYQDVTDIHDKQYQERKWKEEAEKREQKKLEREERRKKNQEQQERVDIDAIMAGMTQESHATTVKRLKKDDVDKTNKMALLKKQKIGQEIEFREGGSNSWNYSYRYTKTPFGWLKTTKKNNPSQYGSKSAKASAHWTKQKSFDALESLGV